MRARWLKPEFFNDRKMGSLGPIPALVFQALWCMADDGGTALCNPEIVKGQMFIWWPAVGLPEVSEGLRQLSEARRIKRYSIGDDEYAIIVNWEKHQSVHNPSKFRYPPPVNEVTGNTAAVLPQEGGSPQHLDTQIPRSLEAEITTSTTSEAVIAKLPEEYRPDLVAFLKSLGREDRQQAWVRNLDAVLGGIGDVPAPPERVGAAIRQLIGNGEKPNWNLFRGYLRNEGKQPAPPKNGTYPQSRVSDEVKGAAMLILGDLRKTRQTIPTPNGNRYTIAKSEIEALPPAASRALMAIGGAQVIASADENRFSILISQFATAYAGAIAEEKTRIGARA